MKVLNCIIIDNTFDASLLREILDKITLVKLIDTFTNPFDAIEIINSQKIDIIIIDIEMPQISGIEFIKLIPKPPLIIFMSSSSHYAIHGYELNIIDYILKPFSSERFLKSIYKAYEIDSLKSRNKSLEFNDTYINQNDTRFMMIKVEYCTIKVDFNDILFIEGLKDYVKIITKQSSFLTKGTMKNLEERLPMKNFIRIHKSFIISISSINKIENNRILIKDKRLPIGGHYKTGFYDMIKTFYL